MHRHQTPTGTRKPVSQVLIAYDDRIDQNIVAVFRGEKRRFYHVDVSTLGLLACILNRAGANFHGQTFTDHLIVEAVTL